MHPLCGKSDHLAHQALNSLYITTGTCPVNFWKVRSDLKSIENKYTVPGLGLGDYIDVGLNRDVVVYYV